MKVLVVDDSKLARMAVAKVLNAVHPEWTRIEAATADAAVVSVRDAAPDIAVLDYNMPGRDGLTLAAEAKALRPAMQIAVISANHQQEVVDRALALGATFLMKPLTEQALRDFLLRAEKALQAGAR
jgi:DNA-binding NarL/FixJ family response regulator